MTLASARFPVLLGHVQPDSIIHAAAIPDVSAAFPLHHLVRGCQCDNCTWFQRDSSIRNAVLTLVLATPLAAWFQWLTSRVSIFEFGTIFTWASFMVREETSTRLGIEILKHGMNLLLHSSPSAVAQMMNPFPSVTQSLSNLLIAEGEFSKGSGVNAMSVILEGISNLHVDVLMSIGFTCCESSLWTTRVSPPCTWKDSAWYSIRNNSRISLLNTLSCEMKRIDDLDCINE